MRTIQVQGRQNIIDIAVQYYGTAASVIDLCQDNNLELDADLVPGSFLQIQDTYPDSANPDVADYIQGNNIVVVSLDELNEGDVLGTNDGNIIITNNGNNIGA
jgi:hypothetical protein